MTFVCGVALTVNNGKNVPAHTPRIPFKPLNKNTRESGCECSMNWVYPNSFRYKAPQQFYILDIKNSNNAF